MGVADRVVGHPQILVRMHLTAGPDAAIAVLVAGEILEDRLRERAVRVRGIGVGYITADREVAIGPGAAVTHETIKVRMGGIALELLDLGSARPGCLADFRAFELT